MFSNISYTLKKLKGNRRVGRWIVLTCVAMIVSLFIPVFYNPLYLINHLTIGLLFGDIGSIVFYIFFLLWSLKHFFEFKITNLKINWKWFFLLSFLFLPMIIGISVPSMLNISPYSILPTSDFFQIYWSDTWIARWSGMFSHGWQELFPSLSQMGLLPTTFFYLFFGFTVSTVALLFQSILIIIVFSLAFFENNVKSLFGFGVNKVEQEYSKNVFSADLSDVETKEFILGKVANNHQQKIIGNLDPNNPADLKLLNVIRNIEEKNKTKPQRSQASIKSEKETTRLFTLKNEIVKKNTSSIEVATKKILESVTEKSYELSEERKKKFLAKAVLSPVHGNLNKDEELLEKQKQLDLEAEKLKVSKAFITEEEITIEDSLEIDIINNASMFQKQEIDYEDSDSIFAKKLDTSLAMSTSASIKEVLEKSTMTSKEFIREVEPIIENAEINQEVITDTPIETNAELTREIELDLESEETQEAEDLIKTREAKLPPLPPIIEKPEIPSRPNNWCAKYKLPMFNVFTDVTIDSNIQEAQEEEAKVKSELINQLFENFEIGAKVSQFKIGPTVTIYEIEIEQGTKIIKITNLEDNIKLTLEAKDIRIQAPIPGRNVLGIEVPNNKRRTVSFKETLIQSQRRKEEGELLITIGQDVFGNVLSFDLAKAPHLLVAGSTGSGKSVAINTIISSLLARYTPNEVNLVLIDPKMVEFSSYHSIPHLITPVVTTSLNANLALKAAVNEMEERYRTMASLGVKNIVELNKKISLDNKPKLPYLVVIVDELADLMLMSPKEVEESIMRITQKARAAGIHIILATQRPSVDIITGVIKSNIPSRIAFTVASAIDSRTILDRTGAEKLVGMGDMLVSLYGQIPFRGQGSYISNDEVDKLAEHVKNQCNPIYTIELKQEEVIPGFDSVILSPSDPEFVKAKALAMQQGKISTSMIQRYMNVGYNKAANIIDSLHHHGIIGPQLGGNKPREVIYKDDK